MSLYLTITSPKKGENVFFSSFYIQQDKTKIDISEVRYIITGSKYPQTFRTSDSDKDFQRLHRFDTNPSIYELQVEVACDDGRLFRLPESIIIPQRTTRFPIDSQAKELIIFIHGFCGDKIKTWRNFQVFIEDDPELSNKYCVNSFGYSTGPFRYKFCQLLSINPKIEDVSKSLVSYIDARFAEGFSKFTLLTHSMGGLIAAYYLTNKYKKRTHQLTIDKLLLFAVPCQGSNWANYFASFFTSQTVPQLCLRSDFIIDLQEKWKNDDIVNNHIVNYVSANDDPFVNSEDACNYWGIQEANCHSFPLLNHKTLVKPGSPNSDLFTTTKRVLQS